MPVTYEPIATTSMSGTYTVDFTSIPSTYTDLRLVIHSRMSAGGGTSSQIFINLNNDYTGQYSRLSMIGDGSSTPFVSRSGGQTEWAIQPGSAGSGSTSDIFGLSTVDILSYAGTTRKSSLATCALDRDGAGNIVRSTFLWFGTSAINRITLTDAANNNFASGSRATLYGILRA
jgi:hypothetical protein